MKIFGYKIQDSKGLLELKEVTFEITADQAKSLGNFFLKCSQEINNPYWEHEHFNDGLNPDVVVYAKRE